VTDWLLGLIPQYGGWLLGACTFLSCIALPIPASILMLTAGGFVSSGDLSLASAVGGALIGAVAGDQAGYLAGHKAGHVISIRMGKREALLKKAERMLAHHGGFAVFFSRWLFSALGPYVNLAAGFARQSWASFTAWGVAGEAVWVSLYVGLGYAFTGNIEAASQMALQLLGFFAAGAIAIGLAVWLYLVVRHEQKNAR
jgi:membrane-associated protein